MAGVGCWGRLPIQADFVRHNALAPELEGIERWFQEGMEISRQANRGWEEEFWQAQPLRFLWTPKGSDRLIVGSWVASSDKGGRQFPFTIFSIPEGLALGSECALAPVLFYDFLKSAQEIALNGWNGADLLLFQTRVNGIPFQPDLASARKKYAQYLSTKTNQQLWTSLFGSFDHPKKYALILNLVDRLQPVRKGESVPTVLRLPLVPAVIPGFWIDLALKVGQRSSLPTIVSWTAGTIAFLFHVSEPKFFRPMFRPDLPSENACDLAREKAEDPDHLRRARELFGGILSDPNLPLPEVLQLLVSSLPLEAQEPAPKAETIRAPAPKPPEEKPPEEPPPPVDLDLRIQSADAAKTFGRASGPVSPYGKLPIFADFIRPSTRAPEIDTLDQWFQEGITVARATNRAWDQEFAKAPPARFLFVSPATGRLIVGAWIAGVDKPGRRYPFLIFRISEQPPLGREGALAPLLFSDFLHQAEEIAVGGWKGLDLRSFQTRVDGLTYTLDLDGARRAYGEYLASKTGRDLWTALLGSFDDPRKYTILQNIADLLQPLRTGSQSRVALALRFPRAPGVEASFWLDFTLRMSGRSTLPPLVHWTTSSFTVLFNELNPKYYAPLVRSDMRSEHVCDLALDGVTNPNHLQRAKERYGAALDDGALSLSTLLQKLTGRPGF